MMAGEIEVELVPQGTLIERIRAGGYGLGGVLTPDRPRHPGAEVASSESTVNGKDYLLETALRADFALVAGIRRRLSRQSELCADRTQLQSA